MSRAPTTTRVKLPCQRGANTNRGATPKFAAAQSYSQHLRSSHYLNLVVATLCSVGMHDANQRRPSAPVTLAAANEVPPLQSDEVNPRWLVIRCITHGRCHQHPVLDPVARSEREVTRPASECVE